MLELEENVGARRPKPNNGSRRSPRADSTRDTVILYVDGSPKCEEAARLIEETGLRLKASKGPIAPFHWPPIAVFHGGVYEGVPAIRRLVDSLREKHAE